MVAGTAIHQRGKVQAYEIETKKILSQRFKCKEDFLIFRKFFGNKQIKNVKIEITKEQLNDAAVVNGACHDTKNLPFILSLEHGSVFVFDRELKKKRFVLKIDDGTHICLEETPFPRKKA